MHSKQESARPPGRADAASSEDVVATIAHELSTPLAVVQGAVEAALVEPDPDAQRRWLLSIRRNTELAALLLRRLGLARDVAAESLSITRRPVELAELVRVAVADLRPVTLSEREVTVHGDGQVRLDADAAALRQILFNLLSNAAKYSAPGAPIDIDVRADADEARVVVRNHGTGVAPGDSERIFEKYARLDASTTGVGLGLFVSRALARAHGGELSVRPAAERGSEFRLHLPLRDPDEDAATKDDRGTP